MIGRSTYLLLAIIVCILVGCSHRQARTPSSTAQTNVSQQRESDVSTPTPDLALDQVARKLVEEATNGAVDNMLPFITQEGQNQPITHNAAWQGTGIHNWLCWLGTWPNFDTVEFCYDELDSTKTNPVLPIRYSVVGLTATWSIRFSKREGSWKADQVAIKPVETM